MPRPVPDLLEELEGELAATERQLEVFRFQIDEVTASLQSLADERVAAFIELAEHYLPELSFHTLQDAWTEVGEQIHEILLRQEDDCRQLTRQLQECSQQQHQYTQRRHDLSAQLEKSRRDLLSKRGNARKLLAEDDAIRLWSEKIDLLDAEIEQAIRLLESARADAASKLPEYERCSLFSYLHERKFGTPEYTERGIERRWDRWLARFIDYDRAAESYGLLARMPRELERLISGKQKQYRRLLEKLEQSRARADAKFGVSEQVKLWEELTTELRSVDQQLASLNQRVAGFRLQLETTREQHYQKALKVYRRLLETLDPDVLKLYVTCTESRTDDQLAARLRRLQEDIQRQEDRLGGLRKDFEALRKYHAGLEELSNRIRKLMRERTSADHVAGRFGLGEHLLRMREHQQSPGQVWRALQASLVDSAVRATESTAADSDRSDTGSALESDAAAIGKNGDSAIAPSLLDAAFLAASGQARTAHDNAEQDPLDFMVLSIQQADSMGLGRFGGFSALALCRTRSAAEHVVKVLDEHRILAFIHDHDFDDSVATRKFGFADEIVVMVPGEWRSDAHQLLTTLQSRAAECWRCPGCHVDVEAGYSLCWQCGQRRDTGTQSMVDPPGKDRKVRGGLSLS